MKYRKGFTLVELLVVVAIIMALATLIFAGVKRASMKANQTACMNTIRDVTNGLSAFIVDRNMPPVPETRKEGAERDYVCGDYSNRFPNDYIVAVLEGEDTSFSYDGGELQTSFANPTLNEYTTLARTPKKVNGVYTEPQDQQEGQLFDPWQRTIMIAINVPPFIEENSDGLKDKWLHTDGLAVYPDSEPREEPFAVWSYGKDGVRGTPGASLQKNMLRKSDDVTSW
jgi:prepilin-type N-terminal cleavage/methylation domain-containing protein